MKERRRRKFGCQSGEKLTKTGLKERDQSRVQSLRQRSEEKLQSETSQEWTERLEVQDKIQPHKLAVATCNLS